MGSGQLGKFFHNLIRSPFIANESEVVLLYKKFWNYLSTLFIIT
jgi:hypothetical protein